MRQLVLQRDCTTAAAEASRGSATLFHFSHMMAEADVDFDIPAKVLHYEEFINERLRPDLKRVMDAEQLVCDDMANCEQVCVFLQQLKDKAFMDDGDDGPLKVQTDLGCNFYAEAVV